MRKPEFRWGSEPPPERSWGAWVLAAALHAVLFLRWNLGPMPDLVRLPTEFIALAPLESPGREVKVPIPARVPMRSRGVQSPRATLYSPPPVSAPVPLADRSVAATPPSATSGRPRYERLGPGLGEGKLWVEPLPAPPRQLAAAVTHRDPKELADSFVTAVVQAYLDSIANDPEVAQLKPPSWVATVGGKQFGIDSRHIYIAGLKIPTALLALLPIPGGNQRPIDHNLEGMAYDLRVAAARANNLQDFREAVRNLRRQREADRQYDENRRTPPSDTLVAHPDH